MKKLVLLTMLTVAYLCANEYPFIDIKNKKDVLCTYPVRVSSRDNFAKVILQGFGRGYITLNLCNEHQITSNLPLLVSTTKSGKVRIKTQRKDWKIDLYIPIIDRTKNISFLVFR